MPNIVFQALAEAARNGERVALGIITNAKGSSPQKAGAKALFYADGRIVGTLGGGCLEAEVQQRAVQSLRVGEAGRFELLLDHDFGWDDGLMCGGKVCGLILPNAERAGEQFWAELAARRTRLAWGVQSDFAIANVPLSDPLELPPGLGLRQAPGAFEATPILRPLPKRQGVGAVRNAGAQEAGTRGWLYLETVMPPCALWIAGAGHIAQAVAPLALQLDFRVTVFDDRPALVNHQFFPPEVNLQAEVWERMLALQLPAGPSFGLIVTRGHRHDALVLQEWIHRPFLFLGMIGSARKARTIFEHFAAEKLATLEELRRVACPVGIKIRSQSVQEIAVSILAQFIDKRAELVYEKRE